VETHSDSVAFEDLRRGESPGKTFVAANRREILARTGMFSCAHASLIRPEGASAGSLTKLKIYSRLRDPIFQLYMV